MSKLIRDPLIISVSEFRKLTGKMTDGYTDEEVEQYIIQLDFMAELFIKQKLGGK